MYKRGKCMKKKIYKKGNRLKIDIYLSIQKVHTIIKKGQYLLEFYYWSTTQSLFLNLNMESILDNVV